MKRLSEINTARTKKEVINMAEATENQIITLKKFGKNKEISNGILKGVDFDGLNKEEASDLISQCIAHVNGKNGNGSGKNKDFSDAGYSQNYRNGNGEWKNVSLTDDEIVKVREVHRQYCKEIMEECVEDYPDDQERQLTMFDKRADKIFSWIQKALDEKVRHQRR